MISLTLAPCNDAHRIGDGFIGDQNEIPASARCGELTYEGATDQAGGSGDENHREDYSGGDIYRLYKKFRAESKPCY